MKRKDLRDAYSRYSGAASEVTRKLAFAGIAIVWLFSQDPKQDGIEPLLQEFWPPAILVVLGLLADALQYAYGALAWGAYNRFQEKTGIAEDDDFKAPVWINWPTLAFFWGKLAAISSAYVFLAYQVVPRLLA